ncbi:hypothetical protein VTL71DRAFT_4751 [Oculimacula yallundae]|uniref:HEAT repeat protein n=1 Tax=Oculimacula yallundae TaxID=86028 RepID=A0ABR4C3H9_9HELO
MDPPSDGRLVLEWLESQPSTAQSKLTREVFDDYLAKAAQPRHISGDAGIKLCYYIEQCMRSKSPLVRDVIFAEKPCLDLFHFYIEWNEKNQARSMRQVIELISTMIAKNPSFETTSAIKKVIIQRDISIVTHQAAQPLVKPAFKSLESLMGKKTISAQDLIDAYQKKPKREKTDDEATTADDPVQESSLAEQSTQLLENHKQTGLSTEELMWDTFFLEMFEWMTYADISPATGKFLVTVFRDLRTKSEKQDTSTGNTASWQRWIRQGLNKNPEALENVKNYLFPPLFKLDRVGSLSFLDDLSKQNSVGNTEDQGMDTQSLLQLSAMETGKKAGLVEEPDTVEFTKVSKKPSGAVILQEQSIGLLLNHDAETVRSLAFSVLISSSSTIRPFSSKTLEILQSNMYVLYSDTDAKFRNEILSSTKHMIERLRGATSLLAKEIASLSFQPKVDQEKPAPKHEDGQRRLSAIKEMYQSHNEFVTWYLKFLLLELIPTASYQRHITSLKAIYMFLKSGILKQGIGSQPLKTSGNNTVWPYAIEFFTSGPLRLLMDLLLDPFEDVRSGATSILKLAPHSSFILQHTSQVEAKHDNDFQSSKSESSLGNKVFEQSVTSPGLLVDFIARAEEISKQTGRADHADGVAKSYEVLYGLQASPQSRMDVISQLVEKLERKVNVAERSLGQAVSEAPIHGNFAALTLIWDAVDRTKDFEGKASLELNRQEQLDALQLRMSACCLRIWEAVKDILCNDSPEGHLPEDLEEVDEVDTKDVLSYSFRAIHESSNLMRSLVNKIKLKLPTPESSPFLPTSTFIQIAELSFEQLSTLRHRGAFSTVTSTFAACCQACVHPNMPPASRELLAKWLKVAIQCINTQESTTRRSAGIPALITGILSAHASDPSLDDIIQSLLAIANSRVVDNSIDETQYPQVHALNALKEITRSAGIGSQIEPYIAELFNLAGESFQSGVFSIKNCGLLLIRGLFDNLFGTTTGKDIVEMGWDGKSTQIDYHRYPALVDLIVNLLEMGTDDALFPAMDVLRRAGPPPDQQLEIEALVTEQLANNHWHVRSIAADCLSSLRVDQYWEDLVRDFLKSNSRSPNQRHGQLMVVKAVLKQRLDFSRSDHMRDLSTILPFFRAQWIKDIQRYRNAEIVSKYAEIRSIVIGGLCRVAAQDKMALQSLRSSSALSALLTVDLQDQIRRVANSTAIRHFPAICRSISQNDLYSLAITRNLGGLLPALHNAISISTDAEVAFLEALATDFGIRGEVTSLTRMCQVYVAAMNSSTARVQIAAMQGLCDLLDRHFDIRRYAQRDDKALIHVVLQLKRSQSSTASPALTIARLRMQGWISLFDILARMAGTPNTLDSIIGGATVFWAWSLECNMNGHEDIDFDTRFAAAQALCQFYSRLVTALLVLPNSDALLPSLFGLHSILNDDDSDIRNLASNAISVILKRQINPQAATAAFAEYLLSEYLHSPTFVKFVVCKMTATSTQNIGFISTDPLPLKPAQTQYSEASVNDNQLFAQEKQNLWLDEIENTKIWASTFGKLPQTQFETQPGQNPLHPLVADLVHWVDASAIVLKKASSSEDNALGWTTKPDVFSVLMRSIIVINAVLDLLERFILPAIDESPADWASTGDKLQNDHRGIVVNLGEFIGKASTNRLHPVLAQTLLMREPRRQEVHDRYKIYASSVPPMGHLGLRSLTFPLNRD